jgi:hypothetical protein
MNFTPRFVFSRISKIVCRIRLVRNEKFQKYITTPTEACKRLNWSAKRWPILLGTPPKTD